MKRTDQFTVQLREAENSLSRRDRHLKAMIKQFGPCAIRPHKQYFQTLIESIVSQQLSTKAADTIYGRFKMIYSDRRFPEPQDILATPDETLRAAGISNGKVSFIKDLAAKKEDGQIKFSGFSRMTDEEIIEMLTQVKGIGVWTVHMFLIFALGRLDVLPVGDLGIRKAIQNIYQLDELPNASQITEIAEERKWRPYCSVASWFLWRSLQNKSE